MRRFRGRRLLAFGMLVLLLCCTTACLGRGKKPEEQSVAQIMQAALDNEQKIRLIMDRLTPEEKLGQLVMIGIHGTEADDNSRFMLNQYHLGGIILFDRNLDNAEQTRKLTADLQKLAEVPLFVAIDEEGGKVARGRQFIEAPPAQLEIAEQGKPELATSWARQTAQKLQKLGINVNFAPVADLGSFGTRHYSRDAATVSRFAAAAAEGYEQAGCIYALKHFPGIGKGEKDTHVGSCIVDIPREEQSKEDLLPFREIIKSHDQAGFIVMLTHAIFPQLTGTEPASLSPATGKLLRDELGFQGVIITDDLEMGGATVYPFRELGVRALLAGADIALICHEYAHQQEVYLGLLEALQQGRISQQRIDESVRRVLRAKLKYMKQ